ncbi:MAG: hypothetical protein P4M00_05295 [Azospirillaceae bacterium]|nr:hypothetical protein [Azospirillaceae bacterium]
MATLGNEGSLLPAGDLSTHFIFHHKVFSIEGCRFSRSAASDEPCFILPLGGLEATVPLSKLCAEFDIDAESEDGHLLTVVAEGLNFVKRIRPGDSIPNELLNGTASWSVDDRHLQIARGRLQVQLVSWLTGGETVIVDLDKLEQIVDDPKTRARIQEAFRMIADRLVLGNHGEEAVARRIENLAQELSYIEALRDRFHHLLLVRRGIETASRLYKRDRSLHDETIRMQTLAAPPLADLNDRFSQVDAQTGEILAMLRNFESQTEYIRGVRDDLHQIMMMWDEIIDAWAAVKIDRSMALEQLLKRTYSFLARRFSQGSEWRLVSRPPPT